ncbi:kinase-like domain-containing protein [Paraphysoderma sedebokerense]|nr:kinase-like domain-containing protein [Paraphysoderma sedebokerense]
MGSLSNSYGSANSISLASSVASSFSATFSSSVSPSFSPITPLSPTTPISPTSTTQVINQYIVLNEIGSGSYGKVYLVKNTQDNRYYACKIISKTKLRRQWRWKGLSNNDPDYMAGVKTEIAVLKKLSHHPNITTLVEVLDDTREENLYMVFELCQQGPIMSLKLGETVPFYTETQARKYFRDVLLGVEFLHFNRIIHQDLKPDNILLTADGCAQIADFGVSQICENEDDSLQSKTGSPAFSPPEAISAGSKHVKGKALDIWSLGVTLYCLVHGHVPFEDTDILSLYDRISTCSPPISPSLSPALVDLITKMLTKDPEQRITLDKIKIHPWITNFGAEEMMSTEENCVFEDVTEKEVEDAVSPAVSFLSKFMKIMGKKSRRRSASPSTGQRSYF